MKIGIDVGGTHTDLVVVDENQKIIYKNKVLTTSDVLGGLQEQLKTLRTSKPEYIPSLQGIFIGSTFCLNALLQAEQLEKVILIRLDSGTLSGIPATFHWGPGLAQWVSDSASFSGGFECSGKKIAPLDKQGVLRYAQDWYDKGVRAFAISCPFSPLYPEQEKEIIALLNELGSDVVITASYEIGGIGIFARENAAICNSLLKRHFHDHFSAIHACLSSLGIQCPIWVSQNNGTTMPLEAALRYPIQTLASGPTNSFVGAARLCQKQEAVVIDIGGTSTDIGILQSGYPIPSARGTVINGVQVNFRLPDIRTLALGGGTILTERGVTQKSVGHRLVQEAQCFGGETLTLTDAAVAANILRLQTRYMPTLSKLKAQAYLQEAAQQIEASLQERPHFAKLPCILVGGGAALFTPNYFNEREVTLPQHFDVANAYGAALGELSESQNAIICMEDSKQDLIEIKEILKSKLIEHGVVSESVRCIREDILPFHYLPKKYARVQVTLAGQL